MPPPMQLPAYDYPKNALLNFQPINDAIDSNRAFGLQQQRMGIERERVGMDRERLDMQRAESAEQANMRKVQRWGSIAKVIDDMQDPAQKQALAQRMWQSSPDLAAHFDKMGIDRANPGVWKFLQAEAGKYDPLGEKLKQAQLALTQAQTAASYRREEPDIVRTLRAGGIDPRSPQGQQIIQQSIKGNSPMDQVKADLLRQLMPQQQPEQAPPQPRLQPQSYDGGADPMLVPTQLAPAQAQPQRPPGVFDNLSPQQRTGVGMAIAGMGDAGKIVAEAANQGQFGKEGMNHIDKALVDRAMDLGDLNQIGASFRPEYLGLEGQAKALGAKWQDWLAGGKMDPKQQQFLQGYTQFATATTERLNNRIKALSGAAVSESEAKRMYAANPTTSDGPTAFKAKLDQQIEMNRMAVARYNWLKNQYRGTPEQIADLAKSGRIESLATLDGMKQIYDQRSNQLRQQLRNQNPNASPDQIEAARRKRLQGEFGI